MCPIHLSAAIWRCRSYYYRGRAGLFFVLRHRWLRFLAALRSQLALFQVRDTWYPQRIEIALDDHERFLRALLDNDTELAAQMLGKHIQHAKEGVLADMFPEFDGSKNSG